MDDAPVEETPAGEADRIETSSTLDEENLGRNLQATKTAYDVFKDKLNDQINIATTTRTIRRKKAFGQAILDSASRPGSDNGNHDFSMQLDLVDKSTLSPFRSGAPHVIPASSTLRVDWDEDVGGLNDENEALETQPKSITEFVSSETPDTMEYSGNAESVRTVDASSHSLGKVNSESSPSDSTPSPIEDSSIMVDHVEAVQEEDEKSKQGGSQPDVQTVLAATDRLFTQVIDKLTVTVKDIMFSLNEEFHCKLGKELKNAVRQRLVELMNAQKHEEDTAAHEDEASSDGAAEDEVDEPEYDDEEVKGEDERSDAEYAPVSKRKKKKVKKQVSESTSKRRLSERQLQKPKKVSAVRIHAEQLRKRRLEELRVRNEELQLHQNKEDQKRAELIAAKFETNTDELRLHRIGKRCDLLRKLDQKRIGILHAAPQVAKHFISQEPSDEAHGDGLPSDDPDDDSDDEDQLQLVGKPSVLSCLAFGGKLVQKRSPVAICINKAQRSPGRSLNARAALRNKLKERQRKMGNMWLARELGYKTEEDHIKDCLQVEKRKLEMNLKREEERLRENERRLERERLLAQGEGILEEGEEKFETMENEVETSDDQAEDVEEEDEELILAKELELEANPPEQTHHVTPCLEDNSSFPAQSSSAESPQPVSQGFDAALQADEIIWEHNEKTLVDTRDDSLPVPKQTDVDDNEFNSLSLEGEASRTDDAPHEMEQMVEEKKPRGERNAAWKAMLAKEAESLKKMKRRKGGLVEEEAEEDEEEEVAGLEDFGFKVLKKKKDDDDEDGNDEVEEDDLEHVVDDLSDGEGDEEAGEKARKEMEQQEEKERHKEIMRRMREGYDGRRGGIAAGGVGARGLHRFDQLVAADNREDARRLGLLNDDELESDQDDEKGDGGGADEEEDEGALLDKMLKDRFLHRSSVELEENFSEDEEHVDGEVAGVGDGEMVQQDPEEREQERLARRFAKRARMQRILEDHGEEEEFSQSRLIDEDPSIKLELQQVKNVFLGKRSLSLSAYSSNEVSGTQTEKCDAKRLKLSSCFGGNFINRGGSLSIALQASRARSKTSFVPSTGSGDTSTFAVQKGITTGHVVFQATSDTSSRLSRGNLSRSSNVGASNMASKPVTSAAKPVSTSLWSQAIVARFQKQK